MEISEDRKEEIKGRVDALIRDYREPPIPVFDVARQQGVRVWIADFGKIERKYSSFCDFEKREIYLNRIANVKRRAFAAAHELGRLLLHEDTEERFAFLPMNSKVKDGTEQEHEANFFAQCLLLPKIVLERHIKADKQHIFASAFDVPLDVLRDVLKERQIDLEESQKEEEYISPLGMISPPLFSNELREALRKRKRWLEKGEYTSPLGMISPPLFSDELRGALRRQEEGREEEEYVSLPGIIGPHLSYNKLFYDELKEALRRQEEGREEEEYVSLPGIISSHLLYDKLKEALRRQEEGREEEEYVSLPSVFFLPNKLKELLRRQEEGQEEGQEESA